MAEQCNPTVDAIMRALGGFTCHGAPAVVNFHNPFTLSNATLPVLEAMMVLGAVLALVHAVRRLRRDGDPANLVLWFAAIVYSLVTEIPLYFANVFHIENSVGVVFAHNLFTVQFLYDRLPLYIVALYPALISLSYEIVRSLGAFTGYRRYGAFAGAVCVGFVHHCLYEVFDQLGPQLRWWAWNTNDTLNHPMLSSVPMTSVVIFATLGPAVLAFLVQILVARPIRREKPLGAGQLALRTLLAGILVPVGIGILAAPSSAFGGKHPNTTAQAIVFTIELVIIAAASATMLTRRRRRIHRAQVPDGDIPNRFVTVFGSLYLITLFALWISALPDYFGAKADITSDGTPTGNLFYATACFLAATIAVAAVSITGTRRHSLTMPGHQLVD